MLDLDELYDTWTKCQMSWSHLLSNKSYNNVSIKYFRGPIQNIKSSKVAYFSFKLMKCSMEHNA